MKEFDRDDMAEAARLGAVAEIAGVEADLELLVGAVHLTQRISISHLPG